MRIIKYSRFFCGRENSQCDALSSPQPILFVQSILIFHWNMINDQFIYSSIDLIYLFVVLDCPVRVYIVKKCGLLDYQWNQVLLTILIIIPLWMRFHFYFTIVDPIFMLFDSFILLIEDQLCARRPLFCNRSKCPLKSKINLENQHRIFTNKLRLIAVILSLAAFIAKDRAGFLQQRGKTRNDMCINWHYF